MGYRFFSPANIYLKPAFKEIMSSWMYDTLLIPDSRSGMKTQKNFEYVCLSLGTYILLKDFRKDIKKLSNIVFCGVT